MTKDLLKSKCTAKLQAQWLHHSPQGILSLSLVFIMCKWHYLKKKKKKRKRTALLDCP